MRERVTKQRSVLLDRINEKFSGQLSFIGFIDDKASLLEYRRIKKVYNVPIERQESLNVQIALVTSLVKNWNDVFGSCRHINYSSDDYDVVFLEALGSTMVMMASPGAGQQLAKRVIEMIAETL